MNEQSRTRRDTAKEERLEILQMLESGAITSDEAASLLDALDRADRVPLGPGVMMADSPTQPISGRARHMRIRVTNSDTGRAKVNLTLPLGLIDAGFGIARRFAPDRIGDAEAIRDAITTGFRGPLLDVEDNGDRVEIIVE